MQDATSFGTICVDDNLLGTLIWEPPICLRVNLTKLGQAGQTMLETGYQPTLKLIHNTLAAIVVSGAEMTSLLEKLDGELQEILETATQAARINQNSSPQ